VAIVGLDVPLGTSTWSNIVGLWDESGLFHVAPRHCLPALSMEERRSPSWAVLITGEEK
jgi:hypothetical protein